jgi:hypothetical protein
MIFGLRKLQWLIILPVIAFPILLNFLGIWQDIGSAGFLQIFRGEFRPFPQLIGNYYSNPLPGIFFDLSLLAIPLGVLSWLEIFITNQPFFQKQPHILQIFLLLLLFFATSILFSIDCGFIMPLKWLPVFHDYLGMPGSSFMEKWSSLLVLPLTFFLLSIAVLIDRTSVLIKSPQIQAASSPPEK